MSLMTHSKYFLLRYIPQHSQKATSSAILQTGFLKRTYMYIFQVQQVQESAAKLIVAYSGDKAREIQDREAAVVNAWRNLQIHVEGRKNKLADSSDLYRFFGMVKDLVNWMNDMTRQMSTQEKPRWNIFLIFHLLQNFYWNSHRNYSFYYFIIKSQVLFFLSWSFK